ncbi:hypothetical protein [Paenarthrobacter nitroguajacolicus]|uniref:hypothetical protein n=1 Tax=Paenarthrobacter nitroguajacolicus TaxID=211146 RepID=UPI0040544869
METLIVAAAVFAVPLAIAVVVVCRIFRPKTKDRVPAHRGTFQSQRGRVYSKGGTYRNASPSDGTGGGF